jgi:hypothetical protein
LRDNRKHLLIAGIGLGTGLAAHALEARDLLAFSAGPVLIRPRLSVAEEYNDNLFYGRGGSDPVSDFLTTVTPSLGLHLGKPGAAASADLGYAYSHLWYIENSDNESEIHQINLGLSYQQSRFFTRTTANYGQMDTIYGGYESFSQGGGTGGANILRETVGLTENLGYDLTEKLEAHGSFTLTGTDFLETGTFYDQNVWRVLGGLGHQIRPKVHLIADCYYGQTASTPNLPFSSPLVPVSMKPPHMSTIGGYGGANLSLTERISAHAKVGYETSEFADDSFSGLSADVGGDAKIGDRLSVTLAYRRGTSASVRTYATGYISDTVTLGVTEQLGSSVRPWQLSLNGTYGGNSNETGASSGSRSTYFDISLGVKHQPKEWLTLALTYSHSEHFGGGNSSVDYQVNRVTLSASVGY